MGVFDLLEEIIYEIKKRYIIWKNGCKKCDLFDECFDYLDGKRCFIKEQNNGNNNRNSSANNMYFSWSCDRVYISPYPMALCRTIFK